MTRHEELRRQLWINIAASIAQSGQYDARAMTAWANTAVRDFDAKFSEPDTDSPMEPIPPSKANLRESK